MRLFRARSKPAKQWMLVLVKWWRFHLQLCSTWIITRPSSSAYMKYDNVAADRRCSHAAMQEEDECARAWCTFCPSNMAKVQYDAVAYIFLTTIQQTIACVQRSQNCGLTHCQSGVLASEAWHGASCWNTLPLCSTILASCVDRLT